MNVIIDKGIKHLDLHGIRHYQVADIVINFCYKHQEDIPLIIVCGNSNKMVQITKKTLDENSIRYSSPRFGIIRVEHI